MRHGWKEVGICQVKFLFLLIACFMAASLSDGCDSGAGQGIPTPRLSALTQEQARSLAAFARRMMVEDQDTGELVSVAWSMVNWCCEERAMALQFALASAPESLTGEAAVMRGGEVGPEYMEELMDRHRFDFAVINLTGPLAAYQTIVHPDGYPLGGDPQRVFWPVHHGVVLNVEGTLKVIDLSVSDEPLAVSDWVSFFIAQDALCAQLDDTTFQRVYAYWQAVMMGWDAPEGPPVRCGYTITPAFTWRWDQAPLYDVLSGVPQTLAVQTGAFVTMLSDSYGIHPEPDIIPWFTSLYEAKTIQDVCLWVDLPFCSSGSVP